jgi:hypothetical protein
LRTACEELSRQFDWLAYFPSYEIITGAYTRGRYFAEDLRSVTEEGVEHVMRLFLKHATDGTSLIGEQEASSADQQKPERDFVSEMAHVVNTICEEELIEISLR